MLATAFRAVRGRPATGPGHYLRDIVYGANDGVITTFAIVAGVSGAGLEARVALILGLANVVADGISMGVSNYLSLKSELLQDGRSVVEEMPWRHGLASFAAFLVAGLVPLTAFFLEPWTGIPMFVWASVLAALAFSVIGGMRAPFVGGSVIRAAGEMLVIGGAAGVVAYLLGLAGDALV